MRGPRRGDATLSAWRRDHERGETDARGGAARGKGLSFFAVVRVLADPRRPAPYGAVLRAHFGGTFLYWAFLFFVVAPLTMRLIAEERRQGTWEVLRTAPVLAAAIVAGKWMGALVSYLALWVPTL